jgi:hypothetical protein
MDQCAPIATLNGVYDAEVSNDARHAVDTFAIRRPVPATRVTRYQSPERDSGRELEADIVRSTPVRPLPPAPAAVTAVQGCAG